MRRFYLILLTVCVSVLAHAQTNTTIRGVVHDEFGVALQGVSVHLKNQEGVSVATNAEGTFELTSSESFPIEVELEYLGYQTQVVTFTSAEQQTITLVQSGATAIEEVVAVGYGTVRKGDLTGSVGTVSGKDLQERGTTSVMSALQGTVPGVDISSSSARPGGGFNIQIRGQNSLQDGGPLYVVDGVVTSSIDFLNPADIEQIDVLKDASSTAIYGSRGSNGVVIVKTKNAGTPGSPRTTVTYDGFYGLRKLARIPDFMDGREWVDFRTSAYYTYEANGYALANQQAILQNSPLLESRLYHQDYTDWLSLGTQTGQQQNHYIGIAAATDKLNYNLGVGYQNEEGNFINEELDRYSVKLSVEHKTSELFSTGASINFVHGINNFGSEHGYRDIMRMPNILSAYDDNGNLITQPGIATAIQGSGNFTSSPNPLQEINSGTEEIRQYDVLGSIFAELRPLENLSIRSTFLPRFNRTRTGAYYGRVLGQRNQDVASQINEEALEWTWDNVINYNTTFNEDHRLNVSLIHSMYKTRFEMIQAESLDLPYPSMWYNIFSGTFVPGGSGTGYNETSLLSYAARANYDYKGRYLLTGTLRYDGSSKLANRWAAFPSAALAWRMSEESFMQDLTFVNDLKARVSLGYSGNNNGIQPYGSQLTPQTSELLWYTFGGGAMNGFPTSTPVSPTITWEKTRELNVGVDFSLWSNRISGSVDWYDKLSDGLLMQRTLTVESGVPFMMDNIGSVNNRGIEVGLNTINVNTSDWEWTTSFVFGRNKNAIRSLYGKTEDVVGEARFIGHPIDVVYDFNIVGLWRVDQAAEAALVGQQPGQAIAADTDGDGQITLNDRVILGSSDPKWTGSFTSNLRYKSWDLSFNFFTRQGIFVDDRFLQEFGPDNTQRGRPKVRYDYYIPPGMPRYDWNNWGTHSDGSPQAIWGNSGEGNENAQYPHPQNKGPFYGGNGRYTDASFVKLRNIIVGYNLPSEMISKWKMSQFRIYANVLNPLVFTNYQGWDPEYATTALSSGNGPSNVTYQLGVNIRF